MNGEHTDGVTRRRLLTGSVLLGGIALIGTQQASAAASRRVAGTGFDTAPAAAAVHRLLPDHHRQITLRAVTAPGGDRFTVDGTRGRITVEGTSPAVLLAGVNAYLRHTAHAAISWNGDQLDLPRLLPAPAAPISAQANVPHRFALNDTNDGYTGPYRHWDAWERELDVLALHGVNEVFLSLGGDAVYYDTFREFGYSDTEMRTWIPAPAHQPWWLLQNMSGFGGPLSRQLLEKRAELAAKIIGRVRELGMVPVLPGYFGTVPDGFPARHPGASVVPQGTWGAFKRPDWLDPRTGAFAEVAAVFYAKQSERLGDSGMFKMDLLHEGGQAGDVPVGEAAEAVEAALRKAHLAAIWAILGWQTNPRRDILDAVDKTKILIVDGLSDRYPTITDRESDWGGTPYAYGSIWNFGGHTPMGANAPDWVEWYPKWRQKEGSALSGIAAMPEAADNNAPALALLTDLAWTPGAIDLDDWFAAYATSRYGGEDQHTLAAWRTIRETAYGMTRKDTWSEAPDGLFGARPSLTASKAASWGPESDRYDTTAYDHALTELLQISPELRDSGAYRYDVTDVARQTLSNRTRILLPQIKAAYETGDTDLFCRLTRTWLDWMRLMDTLLATSPHHLLGRWLADARSWGETTAEKDLLEYDARSILTTWGDRSSADEGLHDYANREWSGLLSGLYHQRWSAYFDELTAALAEGRAPRAIDWYAIEDAWNRDHGTYPTASRGDAYRLAREVHSALAADRYSVVLGATADRGAVSPDRLVTVSVSFTNRNGFAPATDVTLSASPPPGLTAAALGPVTAASVAPGTTFTADFRIGLSGPADALVARIPFRASGRATASVRLLADTGVQEPYRTANFNAAAVFGQLGDQFAIEGGGADLWGATQEFGAIYRPAAFGATSTATVEVTSQDATGPWARAGLMARNVLSAQGISGYVNLAVTPSNGCVLSWASADDGRIDRILTAGSATAPVWLRLTRSGATYTGEYSTDGTTWTTVGIATPGAPTATQDIGVFMTAAHGGSGMRGIVEFREFTVG